jgi:hypothetical protein
MTNPTENKPTASPPADQPAEASTDTPTDAPVGRPRQGWTPPLDDPAARQAALNHALDYRGDVTLELTDGRIVTGYIFDRRTRDGRGVVRMELAEPDADGQQRVTIDYDQIARLVFTGRDPAAGKSWENWIRRYAEKKIAGERAEIAAEPLE